MSLSPLRTTLRAALLAAAVPLAAQSASAAPATPADVAPAPCRLRGVEVDVLCGSVSRPLDPTRPDGTRIDVHYVVLPALARNKKPDPVLFFAGGPGQSAIALAGPLSRMFARLTNRRDVVLVDQRGTGRSAPLVCDTPDPAAPLRELADPGAMRARLGRCLAKLQALPYGDLRQFTTTIAMADADAVRAALGAERVDVVGGSYGTRAALEYLRQFPQHVRRTVIDGVAPPDMVLPETIAPDGEAALDALFTACEAEPACNRPYPTLRAQWRALRASMPREVTAVHPVTGRPERFTLDAEMAVSLLRGPLYAPALASALPLAITEASAGRFEALIGLGGALTGGRKELALAEGMHFSVLCAEDAPRMSAGKDPADDLIGGVFAKVYREVCADWPPGSVPPAFYTIPPSPTPVLVLSGGIDPVTPPRHGAHAAEALGPKARHVVVPNAGHGLMGIGCMRDVLYRFIDAEGDDEALAVDTACVQDIPRPPAFQPVRPAAERQAMGGAR